MFLLQFIVFQDKIFKMKQVLSNFDDFYNFLYDSLDL